MKKIILTIIVAFSLSAPLAHADIETDLVGWWKYDETSGTTALDSAGSNNGTHVNSPSYLIPGKVGASAIQLVKASQQYTTVDGFTNNLTDFTACVWFKTTSVTTGNYQRLLDKNYTGGFFIGHDGGSGDNAKWGGGLEQGAPPFGIYVSVPDVTAWNLLCSIRSGTTHYINLNAGAVTASETVSGSAFDSSPLTIGSSRNGGTHSPDDDFDGYIDEVRIYSRALSAGDLTELYAYPPAVISSSSTLPISFKKGNKFNVVRGAHLTIKR